MLVLLIFLLALFTYLYVKLKYFTLRGPLLGLSPHILVGNLIQSGMPNGATTAQIFPEFKRRFGNVFQFWFGYSRLIVVNGIGDAQHIFTHRDIYDQGDLYVEKFGILVPEGLLSIKGAKFKRHASLTLPLFHRVKIISNFDLMIDCTDKLLSKWRSSSPETVHVDIVRQCHNLILTIFGFIAFDYDLEALDDDDNTGKSHNDIAQALRDMLDSVQIVLRSPDIIGALYLKLSPRYRRAQATVERYCQRIIDQELAQSPESIVQRKRTSLIASLVSSLQQDENAEAKKSEEEKKGLSRRELLDEMVLFLFAGFETVATALAWFIHHVSKHPRVQQKIKAELMDDDEYKQPLSLDRLESLVYLDAVINEVLRYSPPADITFRTLTANDRLPESGAQLNKGDQVCISIYNLGRDPQYWSIDPERFYPERFLEEDKSPQPYAFLPFGSGHRRCIGQELARFELKEIIARLMQHVTFGDGGPQLNAGGHVTTITTMPKHVGVTIQFQ